ncbi:MAG: S8 family serine peptidase [Bacteroidales bacterium]|nr:S8 family serine peptidase [Bacteroidales bacterium]
MKKNLIAFAALLLLGIFNALMAQPAPTCYRITLTDKQNNPYSVNNPSAYLSERAIAKRVRFNIPITEQDLPVNPQYIQQIQQQDAAIRVLCTSKWSNTVTIYCPDSLKLSQIQQLSFVSDILPVANYPLDILQGANAVPEVTEYPVVSNPMRDSIVPYDYGYAYDQIVIHNGHLLHNLGFRGDSMLIVVFDAGWDGVDTSSYFRPLFENGQIWGTRDLIPWSDNVFNGHYHGTLVTSTMSMLQESAMVGTAPHANYYFIRSEEPNMEELIEEDFWAQAAEIADSLGADVINSSLGYSQFADFPQCDYTYASTDGVTSIASRAATTLGQKGVVVCVSAGNDGNNEWYHISRPADAFDILTVGAVDFFGQAARFSSRGPSYDGRVKPDIASVGVSTVCIWPGDFLGTADGTSLAGPVAAGLCACLWQALPNATSTELMQIIRESGSCYQNPNDSLGYGIPDFYAAYANHVAVDEYVQRPVEVFPNPCTYFLKMANPDGKVTQVEIYTENGVLVKSFTPKADYIIQMDVQDLPVGFYVGKSYQNGTPTQYFKFVKN